MKKIEELLNIDLGRKFDTPKKLNRSRRAVPAEIVEALESGEFTAEMIQELATKFPIFYYRTCITIHGAWPEVSRQRIGNYRNVIQNGNGSIEVRYSAIDRTKIREIGEGCRNISKFQYQEDSQSRSFNILKPITRETLAAARAELEPIAKRLIELPIYGYVNLYTAATPWGQVYLVLSVKVLAVRQENTGAVILALCGMDADQHRAAVEKRDQATREEDAARKLRLAEYDRERQEQKAAQAARVEALRPQIAHLAECNDVKTGVLVKVCNIANSWSAENYGFKFIKYGGPGAFGRVKVSTATAESFSLEGLQWKDGKQKTADELKKLQGWRLAEVRTHVTPRLPKATAPSKAGAVLANISF